MPEFSSLSTMSLAIVPLYLGVAGLAFHAGRYAARAGRPVGERRTWIMVTIAFVSLAALRLANAEDRARSTVRAVLHQQGEYAARSSVQIPLTILVLALLAGLVIHAWRTWPASAASRTRQLLALARYSVLGYLPLFAMRLISLHITDQLLYSGPIRLNWIADGGLALLAGFCAALYPAATRRDRH